MITSSGSSRSKFILLGFDTVPAHCCGFKKRLDVCVGAGSVLYRTLQGQCADRLTLQELSQIRDSQK